MQRGMIGLGLSTSGTACSSHLAHKSEPPRVPSFHMVSGQGTILLVSLIFHALLYCCDTSHWTIYSSLCDTIKHINNKTVPTATNDFIKEDGRHLFKVMLAPLKTLLKFSRILVPFCGPWLQPLAGIMRSWSAQSLNWGRAQGKM